METSLVHCLGHDHSCFALVTIRGNEHVIFPCIALYIVNISIYILLLDHCCNKSCDLIGQEEVYYYYYI